MNFRRLYYFFATIVVAISLFSCSDSVSMSSVPKKVESTISSVNLDSSDDVVGIIQKSASSQASVMSRASSAEGWFVLHADGTETPFEILGANGKKKNVDFTVYQVSDKILYIFTDPMTAIAAAGIDEDKVDDEDTSFLWKSFSCFVADVTTGKLYQWPVWVGNPARSEVYNGSIDTDVVGNYIYGLPQQQYGYPVNISCFYRLNTTNFTVEEIPAFDIYPGCKFKANSAGYITYNNQILCPGGRIVKLDGYSFVYDDYTYSIIEDTIYRWVPDDAEGMVKERVCGCPQGIGLKHVMNNFAKNRELIVGYCEIDGDWQLVVSEFDGKELKNLDLSNDIKELLSVDVFAQSSVMWFYGYESYYAIDMLTYQKVEFGGGKYVIKDISSAPGSDVALFSAIQYSNQAQLIGKISRDGKVSIISEQPHGTPNVYQLIPLN